MIPTSTNPTLQNIANPTNTIASQLPSVRNPSPHSITYSIPRVPSFKQLPTTNSTSNETNHDNINKNLVSELKKIRRNIPFSLEIAYLHIIYQSIMLMALINHRYQNLSMINKPPYSY